MVLATTSISINSSGNGGNKTVTEICVNLGAGNKFVTQGWVGTGAGNKQFFSGLSVSDNGPAQSAVDGTGTNTVTVTVQGGSGSQTILWTRISGSTSPSISSTTAFSVDWSVPTPRDVFASWGYTVTDSGAQASGTVGVFFESSN